MGNAGLRVNSGRIPPVGRLVRVTLGLILLTIAASALDGESYKSGGMSLVWLPNGFLLGVMLCAPKRQWPTLFALGYAVDLCLNFQQGNGPGTALYLSVCNMVEVMVGAQLMYPAVAEDPDLTQWRQLKSLLLYGVLLGPATTSLMTAVYLRLTAGASFSHAFRWWFAADALGIAMTTPLYLSYHHGKKFSPRSKLETGALFLLIFVVSLLVFRWSSYPTLWVVLLFLLLLGVRLGFTGSALGLLLVSYVGGYFTVEGYGPLGLVTHDSVPNRILVFQAFIGFSMLALYFTEVAMAANRRMLVRLEASETRFRSLAETSRDVIVLSELNGRRKYVSPAMTELLGWEQEELIDQPYSKTVHAEDLPRMQQFMQALRDGVGTSSLAYRGLKRDGSYLWLEATARLLCNPQTQEPYGFVHVLRDISDRKAAEEQMQQAYETVEQLALMDGLTGVANRRLLDQTLSREWVSSRRDRTPLSVILIDVDHFKSFNDRYGHLQGDECLRQVAAKMQTMLRRPLDLLARYGGEEFVAVLPNTPTEGAQSLANLLRKAVEQCAIPHTGSPHNVVTVSLGCATEVPSERSSLSSLLQMADAAMYRAKSGGRNRTEVACEADMSLR